MANLTFSGRFAPGCLAALVLALASPLVLSGQYLREEATHYTSRPDGFDPVKLSVDQGEAGVLKFIVTNETYYPFTVKITFLKMDNFTAVYRTREAFVKFGKNFLFDLRIKDPESGYELDYNFSYVAGKPEAANETDFIYLVPLKPGSIPVAGKVGESGIMDSFSVMKGDTVYCCRKGIVAALPGDTRRSFRLSQKNALEILHDDGTVMIYNGLAGGALNLAPGMTVYPGDPVAAVTENTILTLQLVVLVPGQELPSLPILYAVDETTGAQFSRIEGRIMVVHPESLIIKEMTPREIKQRGKSQGKNR